MTWDPTNCAEHPCPKIIGYYNGEIDGLDFDCGPGECSDYKPEEDEE